MRLSYKKGSILLGTGYTIYQKSKREIFTAYVLNSKRKMKVMIKDVYIYESQCQSNSPKYVTVLEKGI